jgi:hypothetical protein
MELQVDTCEGVASPTRKYRQSAHEASGEQAGGGGNISTMAEQVRQRRDSAMTASPQPSRTASPHRGSVVAPTSPRLRVVARPS